MMTKTNEERNKAVNNFVEKWREAMKAADEIPNFKSDFKVSITSDDSLLDDRLRAIEGINKSFEENNMK